MAQLFIQQSGAPGGCWAALPLAGRAYGFASAEPYVQRADVASGPAGAEMLVHIVRDSTEQWFVLVPPGGRLWVNGQEALLGARVLVDRDEIRLRHGQRLYFSTERLPEVVPFPGADHEMLCRRCYKPIDKDSPAVACPTCGAWCHERADLACWSYENSKQCPGCNRSTDASAGLRWSPEGL